MNREQFEDIRKQSAGMFREHVGRLCVAAAATIYFKHRNVVDKLQDRYGCVRGHQAHEKLLNEFVQKLRQ